MKKYVVVLPETNRLMAEVEEVEAESPLFALGRVLFDNECGYLDEEGLKDIYHFEWKKFNIYYFTEMCQGNRYGYYVVEETQ